MTFIRGFLSVGGRLAEIREVLGLCSGQLGFPSECIELVFQMSEIDSHCLDRSEQCANLTVDPPVWVVTTMAPSVGRSTLLFRWFSGHGPVLRQGADGFAARPSDA